MLILELGKVCSVKRINFILHKSHFRDKDSPMIKNQGYSHFFVEDEEQKVFLPGSLFLCLFTRFFPWSGHKPCLDDWFSSVSAMQSVSVGTYLWPQDAHKNKAVKTQ